MDAPDQATTHVTDLYQASYLLMNGCELSGVECVPTGGSLSCRMSFRGPRLEECLDAWFEKAAVANLWAFRTAYTQVNSYVHQAKKHYEKAQRRKEAL